MSSDILTNIIKFNSQTNGRDKVCRLVQYGCRLAWGRLQHGEKKELLQVLKTMESMLSMTRKLLRFGKSLDFLQGALKSIHLKDVVLRLTITLSKINQAFYLLFDHLLWFSNVEAIKIDKQYWSEVSARFYLATLVLNCMRDFYGIWCVIKSEQATRKVRSSSSTYQNGDSNYTSVNRRQSTVLQVMGQNIPLILDTIKNLFDLAIPSSTLKFVQVSPTKQGIFGLISSSVAIATVWNPDLKVVPS